MAEKRVDVAILGSGTAGLNATSRVGPAGKPKAARAVGAIMRANHDPSVPCHRVVKSDGTLGGYNRGVERKRELLREECGV